MDTDKFIELLINDDVEQLDNVYQQDDWDNSIDFAKVYDTVRDMSSSSANRIMGHMYHNGKGIPRDHVKALHHYELCIRQGNDSARTHLIRMIRQWDGYIEYLLKTSEERSKEIAELRERNKQLKEENVKLKETMDF